jgi:hypothetical protein
MLARKEKDFSEKKLQMNNPETSIEVSNGLYYSKRLFYADEIGLWTSVKTVHFRKKAKEHLK